MRTETGTSVRVNVEVGHVESSGKLLYQAGDVIGRTDIIMYVAAVQPVPPLANPVPVMLTEASRTLFRYQRIVLDSSTLIIPKFQ
jgi:hypothetical protein